MEQTPDRESDVRAVLIEAVEVQLAALAELSGLSYSSQAILAAIEQPVAERYFAQLKMPILDGPHRSMILGEPDDGDLRHQQGLRQLHRRDVDLGLFAEIEIIRYAVECDLNSAFFVHAIAFGLDPGNLPAIALAKTGS